MTGGTLNIIYRQSSGNHSWALRFRLFGSLSLRATMAPSPRTNAIWKHFTLKEGWPAHIAKVETIELNYNLRRYEDSHLPLLRGGGGCQVAHQDVSSKVFFFFKIIVCPTRCGWCCRWWGRRRAGRATPSSTWTRSTRSWPPRWIWLSSLRTF